MAEASTPAAVVAVAVAAPAGSSFLSESPRLLPISLADGSSLAPRLATGDVAIWRARLDDGDVRRLALADFARCLSDAERSRHAAMRQARDRDAFLVTRGALRTLLGAMTGRPPDTVRLRLAPLGKPFLDDPRHDAPIAFSIAHAPPHVAIAIANRPVGIDVEPLRAMPDLDATARVVFSAPELATMRRLARETRPAWFFRLWTLKEALLKAAGTGFSVPATDITIDMTATPRIETCPVALGRPEDWQLAFPSALGIDQ